MMTIKINGKIIGEVVTNRSLTLEEAMWSLGYDITDQKDCKAAYEAGIEGFCMDECGNYFFDVEAAEFFAE